MSKKFFINTYGCQMNVHESEKLAGILVNKGYVPANSEKEADVILFNTCCVRETAETRVLGNLGRVKKLKESNPDLIVGICGCMPQQPSAAGRISKRCPFIDIIIGTHNMHRLGEYIDELENRDKIIDIWDKDNGKEDDVPLYRTSGVNAWVNIMYGCNNFCTYCIVPYVRGREHSRNSQDIIHEIKSLIQEGYKEVTLLGQNVNSYEDSSNKCNFADLLRQIDAIDGDFRVKFMTSHPKDLSEDVVKAIAYSNKLAHYIHLPIQSGSDRILQLMNRRYTVEQYLQKIDMIRSYIPDIGISSDIMVGFPTETEDDFENSLELIRKVYYNNLYTFIYNRRSGTVADKMDGQVDLQIKTQRIERLIAEQFKIGNIIASQCIGKTYRVLCDSVNNGRGAGKTDCDKSISFDANSEDYGKFLKVEVIESRNNKLIGKIVR